MRVRLDGSRAVRLWRHPPALLQIVAMLVGLALVGLAIDLGQPTSGFAVELTMSRDTTGPTQVFVGGADGYSPDRMHEVDAPASGQLATQRVEVEGALPPKLRIDPGASPGEVDVRRIVIESGAHTQVMDGARLAEAVSPLMDLTVASTSSAGVRLRSTGGDPYFDFAVDAGAGLTAAKAVGATLLAAVGMLLLGWLAWLRKDTAGSTIAALSPKARHAIFLLAIFAAAYLVMSVAGLGCEQIACGRRGLSLGGALLLASAGFIAVGAASFQLLGLYRGGPVPVFASLLAGQTTMVAYIYVRSILSTAVPALPLTRYELMVLAAGAGALLWRRRRALTSPDDGARQGWWLAKIGLLALVCVVVADRELPRLAMLSSDPDTHALFARQLERLGGVYRSQGGWGPEGMNYPAGSAALVFGWASLSFLDVRNALSALPLLLAFVASLAVAEAISSRAAQSLRAAGLAMIAALGVTAAGLAFPVYQQFAHMEGTGRQLSIGMVALACLLCANHVLRADGATRNPAAPAALLALLVFGLTTLNPVNLLAVAVIVIAAAMVHGAWRIRSLWLLAALPAGMALLALDPYYLALFRGQSPEAKLVLTSNLAPVEWRDLGPAWASSLTSGWTERILVLARLVPSHTTLTFALPMLALLAVLAAYARGGTRTPAQWASVAVLAGIGALLGAALLAPFGADNRLYLLPHYFPLALAQYKVMALVALVCLAVAHAARTGRVWFAAPLTVACVIGIVALSIRPSQPMHLAPRHAYCGSMGCVAQSDVEVVHAMEEMVRSGAIAPVNGVLPRVLIPNSEVQAGAETWVFPHGGARYLALADALPVAFFYYHGDPDYTTRNYLAFVCSGLDRDWLARQNIRYVFLPAEQVPGCAGAFATLTQTDRVVVRSGNSSLVELAQPAGW